MKLFIRYIALCAALFCFCLPGQQTETTEVSGAIVNSATGQPIASALVTFNAMRPGSAADPFKTIGTRAVTDASGRFSFDATGVESVDLTISKDGFESVEGWANETVHFTKETPRKNITVKLVPEGALHGRLVNTDGEPLQGLAVFAVRVQVVDGRRQFEEYASMNTDDRGEYRLWHLAPGQYYMKVVGRRGTLNSYESDIIAGVPEAYGPVYFPGVGDLTSAGLVILGAGQDVETNFRLEAHPTRQIRGTILNIPAARPLMLRLLRTGDALPNRSRINLVSGTYTLADVTAGAYVLQAFTNDTGPPWIGEVRVAVDDRDLTGVTVSLGQAVDVTVQIDSAAPRGDLPPLSGRGTFVNVTATAMHPETKPRNFPAATSQWQPNGQVLLKGLIPGQYEIAVNGNSQAYVESVLAGTSDVLAAGLMVPVPGSVTVRLASGGGQIKGKIEGATSDSRWTIVLFPTSGGRPPVVTQAFGGEFETPMLPLGTWNVYALPRGKNIAYREAATLAALIPWMNSVTIAPGANEINLKPAPAEALP